MIGGLLTALFLLVGLWSSLEEGAAGAGGGDTGNVTIKQAPAPRETGTSDAVIGEEGLSVREVYREDAPGVVSVDVTSDQGVGGGSGFVLDKEGHIVTNQHVVEGAEDVSVRFAGGVRETAEIVGEDPDTDVAVIRVDAPANLLRPLTLGDSEAIAVGDPVIAIGNPLNVGISVTTGIVSGLGRPIQAPNDFFINNAVQTDAAISSGNSGGPLFDARGTVIGINSQVASAPDSQGVAQGVGFAVPVNTVRNVVEELITTGEVEHGFIGVSMFDFGIDELSAYSGLSTRELGDRYGLPANGAMVVEVTPGSPADEAGISGGERETVDAIPGVPVGGDVITAVEGEEIMSSDEVIEAVNATDPGDRISLTVVTPDEEPREVEVEIAARPEDT